MKLKSFSVVGLDIGGANIKAVRLQYQEQKIIAHHVAVRPFEIWRHLNSLTKTVQELGRELGLQDCATVAVTMTAELSDAFRTKREGVLSILDAVEQAFDKSSIYPFGLDGSFLRLEDARQTPLLCAASNWLASAGFLALAHPDCILIDIGSTSTDITPIRHGKVMSQGRTDPQRLINGELLYSGFLRTNPNTIVNVVPTGGRPCRVAAEYFTCMADVYLVLGKITPAAYTCPTADGREKTVAAARERLARLVCADCEIMDEKEIDTLARYLWEKQLQQITEALFQVLSCLPDGFQLPLAVVGSGGFLAGEVAKRLGLSVIDFDQKHCSWPLGELPAYAVAYLLARDIT